MMATSPVLMGTLVCGNQGALPMAMLVMRLSGSSWNFVGDPDGLTVRR
jgi:hypothetical protein